jgi:hypothetical protein
MTVHTVESTPETVRSGFLDPTAPLVHSSERPPEAPLPPRPVWPSKGGGSIEG